MLINKVISKLPLPPIWSCVTPTSYQLHFNISAIFIYKDKYIDKQMVVNIFRHNSLYIIYFDKK